jgi:hypothetical protein
MDFGSEMLSVDHADISKRNIGGLFLIYNKYLELLTIENTVLIFQFYK